MRVWSSFNLLWMSFFAVAVWSALGVAASHHLFDALSEAALLLGGGIACLLFLPAWILGVNDTVFMSMVLFVGPILGVIFPKFAINLFDGTSLFGRPLPDWVVDFVS